MIDQKNVIMQNEPNFRKTQMNVTSVETENCENKSNWTLGENEPKTNPIYAKQTQFQTLTWSIIVRRKFNLLRCFLVKFQL